MPHPHPSPPRPLQARQQFGCCFYSVDLNPLTCSNIPVPRAHMCAHTLALSLLPGSSPPQRAHQPSPAQKRLLLLPQVPTATELPWETGAGEGGGGLRGHLSPPEPFLFSHPMPSATSLCQGHADDTRKSIKCHPHVRSCHNIIKALDLRDEAVAINSESD